MNDKEFDEYDRNREAEKVANTRREFEERNARARARDTAKDLENAAAMAEVAVANEQAAIFKVAATTLHRRAQKNEGAAKRLSEIRASMQREIDRMVAANACLLSKLRAERSRSASLEREVTAAYRKIDRLDGVGQKAGSFLAWLFGPPGQ